MARHPNRIPHNRAKSTETNTKTSINDQKVLDETRRLQGQTKAAISRMQRQMTETHLVGQATLETLANEHRETLQRTVQQTHRLQDNLKETERLQNKMSRWTLTFNRRRANRQAVADIQRQKNKGATTRQERNRINSSSHSTDLFDWTRGEALEEMDFGTSTQKPVMRRMETFLEDEERENENSDEIMTDMGRTHSSAPSSASPYGLENKPPMPEPTSTTMEDIDQHNDEIEHALGSLEAQLEGLMGLACQHREQVQEHNAILNDDLMDQIDDAQLRQAKVNHRAQGYFTGGRWRS